MDASSGPVSADATDLLARLAELDKIGIALSREKDVDHLLETILVAAQKITRADAGTLYRRPGHAPDTLAFAIVRNQSLGLSLNAATGGTATFAPIPLHDSEGRENLAAVAAHAVLRDCTINVADAYTAPGFDFAGTRAFDTRTGYRSQSVLCVPLKNHEGDIIGALQLINAVDPCTGAVVPFGPAEQRLAESLASQAAVALTTRQLIHQHEQLFESFITVINTAIDDKSPYTGGHCKRVPVLTMMLAEAAQSATDGPLASWSLTPAESNALRIAALLHDCGKITTPEHIVDKATKLQTIHDRIHLVDARCEIVRRDAELAWLRASAAATPDERPALEAAYHAQLATLADDRAFLHRCNTGGEFMAPTDQARVAAIAQRYRWQDAAGRTCDFLSADEVENLCIARGTLTAAEREIINHHVVTTIKMLEALDWPKHLRQVPEFAGGHHERVDGKGYPRGLTRDQMSVPARIMGIADIFEALTAPDRPYKKGQSLQAALQILGHLSLTGHIDPDLFDIFVRERVYDRYAREHLRPDQIDEVDVTRIPGYRGD